MNSSGQGMRLGCSHCRPAMARGPRRWHTSHVFRFGKRRRLRRRVSAWTDRPAPLGAALELALDGILVCRCDILVVSGCAAVVGTPPAPDTCKPMDPGQRDRMDADRCGVARWRKGWLRVRHCDRTRPGMARAMSPLGLGRKWVLKGQDLDATSVGTRVPPTPGSAATNAKRTAPMNSEKG